MSESVANAQLLSPCRTRNDRYVRHGHDALQMMSQHPLMNVLPRPRPLKKELLEHLA
jgi:hypothetical protein